MNAAAAPNYTTPALDRWRRYTDLPLLILFTVIVGITTFAIVTAKFAEFLVRFDATSKAARDVESDA